jgi:predicted AAA+ superfamily ATPase
MYVNRIIEKEILKASKEYPVIMVCGQRQVGKSTMLNHIKEPNRKYVSLDDRYARKLAHEDVDLFFETYGYPLIIDEFQREPDILFKIKDIVDKLGYEGKDNKGLFWLTGSQKFVMMKNVSETLVGRVALFEMSGLSQKEIDGNDSLFTTNIEELKTRSYIKKDVHEVYETIFRGGLPEIVCSNIDRDRYYENYVNLYLERDIHDLEKVGKLDDFYNFLVYMAARTAQELKYDEISKQIGVSAPTIKSWVTILESSGIVYILRPYFKKVTDRMTKIPKLYFMDTGLAAYLCRWPNACTLESGPMDGAFFETFVVSEIIKDYLNHGKSTRNIYYYRDLEKREIDLIIEEGNSLTPIEIKKNKMPNHPDKNFDVLTKFNMDIKPGLIICLTDELKPYNRKCWYCPCTLI